MKKWLPFLTLAALLSSVTASAQAPVADSSKQAEAREAVYVIPIEGPIGDPTLYIVRRGLKEAIERKVNTVVLDMNTPGGELGATLEIMEALEKFPGRTLTYVNKEAISAGAFISATTQEIWFAPGGVIGASAPVASGGQDIDETMQLKVISYLRARVRAVSEGKGHRGSAIEAMIDKDYELKIGETVIKPKGELLTRTATEAMKTYGEPPQPLLGSGIAANLDKLLGEKIGAGLFSTTRLEVTWSEKLAQYLTKLSPILMGLGMVLLFIEFKTPGFGWIGVSGIALILVVFFGQYTAGLSGHEPAILFVIGVALVMAELIFFPGVVAVALTGVAMMLTSLIWAGADLWPNEPLTISLSGEVFLQPAINLAIALLIAGVLGAVAIKYLPKTSLYGHLVLQGASVTPAQVAGLDAEKAVSLAGLMGRSGVVITALFPSGQVEIEGKRYTAKLPLGSAAPGSRVTVTGHSDFDLTVEKTDQA